MQYSENGEVALSPEIHTFIRSYEYVRHVVTGTRRRHEQKTKAHEKNISRETKCEWEVQKFYVFNFCILWPTGTLIEIKNAHNNTLQWFVVQVCDKSVCP